MGLDSTVFVLEEYGLTAPNLTVSPVHQPEVRTIDGIGTETASTNLATNPNHGNGLVGYTVAGGAGIALTTARWFYGIAGTPSAQLARTTCAAAATNTTGINYQVAGLAANTTYILSRTVSVLPGGVPVNIVASGPALAATVVGTSTTGIGLVQTLYVLVTTNGTGGIVTLSLLNAAPTVGGEQFDSDGTFYEPAATGQIAPSSYIDGDRGPGYAWTGVQYQSTSTRAGGVVTHTIPSMPASPISLFGVIKVDRPGGQLLQVDNGTTNERMFIRTSTTGVVATKTVGGTAVSTSAPVGTLSIADQIVMALTYDGTTLTCLGSRNNGAVLSGSTSSSTVPAPFTRAVPGSNGTGVQANGGLEHLLVFNRALTVDEFTGLALPDPNTGLPRAVGFASDSGITYAAATRRTRGTLSAMSTLGSGLFRELRTLPANFDVASELASATFQFGAGVTHRISVPAGSGVGVGQQLWFARDSARFKVVNAYAPGGQPDELYVTQVA